MLKDEYSLDLASAAIHFIFTIISKYLNTKCLGYIKIYNMFVMQTFCHILFNSTQLSLLIYSNRLAQHPKMF